jgi:hypothetical protein
MTPEDLNNALQSAALAYVREVKQQDVPLRASAGTLATHRRSQNRQIGPTADRQSVAYVVPFLFLLRISLILDGVSSNVVEIKSQLKVLDAIGRAFESAGIWAVSTRLLRTHRCLRPLLGRLISEVLKPDKSDSNRIKQYQHNF